jgi:hypothetical protein
MRELIKDNFDIDIIETKLISDHFGSKAFLVKSQNADYVLKDYERLPIEFSSNFFEKSNFTNAEQGILENIEKAENDKNFPLVLALKERLKHIKRICRTHAAYSKLSFFWFSSHEI